MKYNAFGKNLEVIRKDEKWQVYLLGTEGKKLPAPDIFIPSDIAETDIEGWLEDLLHEWASPGFDKVIRRF